MTHEEVKNIIENASVKKFVIVYNNGEKVTKRLFFSKCGNVCEYLPKSTKYGRPISSVDVWVSLTPITPTDDFVKVKNFLTNVVKYLSASGLWENIKNDYIKILEQGDDYLKHVLELDYTEQRNYLYDTIQVHSFHVDSILYTARKGIVCINYHNYDKETRRNEIRKHIVEGTPYSYKWEKGYDNSVEFRKHNDIKCGWYSTEYRGCGNGHYYLALDEKHAIYGEAD